MLEPNWLLWLATTAAVGARKQKNRVVVRVFYSKRWYLGAGEGCMAVCTNLDTLARNAVLSVGGALAQS